MQHFCKSADTVRTGLENKPCLRVIACFLKCLPALASHYMILSSSASACRNTLSHSSKAVSSTEEHLSASEVCGGRGNSCMPCQSTGHGCKEVSMPCQLVCSLLLAAWSLRLTPVYRMLRRFFLVRSDRDHKQQEVVAQRTSSSSSYPASATTSSREQEHGKVKNIHKRLNCGSTVSCRPSRFFDAVIILTALCAACEGALQFPQPYIIRTVDNQ